MTSPDRARFCVLCLSGEHVSDHAPAAVPPPTSGDVYQRAAREIVKVAPPTDPDMTADDIAQDGDFRALVDIIGRDLAAELARVTAERAQAHARIAELEAEQQNGEWQYGLVAERTGEFVPQYSREIAEAFAEQFRRPIARRWVGPVEPVADTQPGDQA